MVSSNTTFDVYVAYGLRDTATAAQVAAAGGTLGRLLKLGGTGVLTRVGWSFSSEVAAR
jgi:hypothetical protein